MKHRMRKQQDGAKMRTSGSATVGGGGRLGGPAPAEEAQETAADEAPPPAAAKSKKGSSAEFRTKVIMLVALLFVVLAAVLCAALTMPANVEDDSLYDDNQAAQQGRAHPGQPDHLAEVGLGLKRQGQKIWTKAADRASTPPPIFPGVGGPRSSMPGTTRPASSSRPRAGARRAQAQAEHQRHHDNPHPEGEGLQVESEAGTEDDTSASVSSGQFLVEGRGNGLNGIGGRSGSAYGFFTRSPRTGGGLFRGSDHARGGQRDQFFFSTRGGSPSTASETDE